MSRSAGNGMSEALYLPLTLHVSTPDGDLYVTDNAVGDRMLASLVTQYPDAVVRAENRTTGQALARAMPLLRFLNGERGYLVPGGTPPAAGGGRKAA
jgi:hypothetical protein